MTQELPPIPPEVPEDARRTLMDVLEQIGRPRTPIDQAPPPGPPVADPVEQGYRRMMGMRYSYGRRGQGR